MPLRWIILCLTEYVQNVPSPVKQLSRSFLGHGGHLVLALGDDLVSIIQFLWYSNECGAYCLEPGSSHTREAWTQIGLPACYFGTPCETEVPTGTFLFGIYLAPYGPNPGQCLGILELRSSLNSKLSWHCLVHSWLVLTSMPQGDWQRLLLLKTEVHFRRFSESIYLSVSLPMLSYWFWKPCFNIDI